MGTLLATREAAIAGKGCPTEIGNHVSRLVPRRRKGSFAGTDFKHVLAPIRLGLSFERV